MPFQHPPRRSFVLAGVLAAGLVLTAGGCSHLTPLGPGARPKPHQLRSPLVLQAMRIHHQATPTGGCPAGEVAIPDAVPGWCYGKTGTPVTITSAAVSPVDLTAITSSATASGPPGAPPGQQLTPGPGQTAQYGFMVDVPAAEVPLLTAVSTAADNDGWGAFAISVAGKTWAIPLSPPWMQRAHEQFQVMLPSRNQALQLQRILAASN